MTINTNRDAVEFALTLSTTNRHTTPAVRDLAIALMAERDEAVKWRESSLAAAARAEAKARASALQELASLGQAADAHEAQLKAEAERDALQAEVARLRDGLRKCEAEIDQYIRQEYPGDHPLHERYRQRDFAANPARIALEAKP